MFVQSLIKINTGANVLFAIVVEWNCYVNKQAIKGLIYIILLNVSFETKHSQYYFIKYVNCKLWFIIDIITIPIIIFFCMLIYEIS